MMKSMGVACLGLFLAFAAGCGGPSERTASSAQANEAYQESIKAMNALADAYDQNEPEERITELMRRDEETKSKIHGLKLSKQEQERVTSEYGKQSDEAAKRLAKSSNKHFNKIFNKARQESKNKPKEPAAGSDKAPDKAGQESKDKPKSAELSTNADKDKARSESKDSPKSAKPSTDSAK
jgi:hypothetical protein